MEYHNKTHFDQDKTNDSHKQAAEEVTTPTCCHKDGKIETPPTVVWAATAAELQTCGRSMALSAMSSLTNPSIIATQTNPTSVQNTLHIFTCCLLDKGNDASEESASDSEGEK